MIYVYRDALVAWEASPVHDFGLCTGLSDDPDVKRVLKDRLEQTTGDDCAPFNGESVGAYLTERRAEGCHLNPERIAWVRSELELLGL
jgi:hypothetical protein